MRFVGKGRLLVNITETIFSRSVWFTQRTPFSYVSFLWNSRQFHSFHEDTPTEYEQVASNVEQLPEFGEAEKLQRDRKPCSAIIPCFERALDIVSPLKNKLYEVLIREKLAGVLRRYGQIQEELIQRKRIYNLLASVDQIASPGVLYRAYISMDLCGMRVGEPEDPTSSFLYSNNKNLSASSTKCLRMLDILLKVQNFLRQQILSGTGKFDSTVWKDLVDETRGYEACEEYGDMVGYLLVMASKHGLNEAPTSKELSDLITAAVVRYDSDTESLSKEKVQDKDFLRCLSLCNLGQLYMIQNRMEDAERVLTRSLQIVKEVYVPQHPRVVEPLRTLALLYVKLSEPIDAEGLYRSCLDRLNIPGLIWGKEIRTDQTSSTRNEFFEETSIATIAEMKAAVLEDFALLLERLEWNQRSRKPEADNLRKERALLVKNFPFIQSSETRIKVIPGWYFDELQARLQLL